MTSKFTKGSSTFICECCGHNTRFTGNQALGSKTCPICWDLAGFENMEQDDQMTEAHGAEVARLFLELKARSEAEYQKALKSFDLLAAYFPKEEAETVAVAKARKTKYEYPAGLTAAQKKAFRAKARKGD